MKIFDEQFINEFIQSCINGKYFEPHYQNNDADIESAKMILEDIEKYILEHPIHIISNLQINAGDLKYTITKENEKTILTFKHANQNTQTS